VFGEVAISRFSLGSMQISSQKFGGTSWYVFDIQDCLLALLVRWSGDPEVTSLQQMVCEIVEYYLGFVLPLP